MLESVFGRSTVNAPHIICLLSYTSSAVWSRRKDSSRRGWHLVAMKNLLKSSPVCADCQINLAFLGCLTFCIIDVSSGQSSLLNVVKSLGEYLTAEEEVLRSKGLRINNYHMASQAHLEIGVDFLSIVISRCPAEAINRQASELLPGQSRC